MDPPQMRYSDNGASCMGGFSIFSRKPPAYACAIRRGNVQMHVVFWTMIGME